MGIVQRLDDLDTKVIGRGDPNWNSATPKPWTPETGALLNVRKSYVPYAWTLTAAGTTALALLVAFPGDPSTLEVLLWVGFLPLSWCATSS